MLGVAASIWLGFPNDLDSWLLMPLLVLLWPVCLVFAGLGSPGPGHAMLRGWLGCTVGFCAALYWLCLPLHNVGNLPYPLAIACCVMISACLAVPPALACLATHCWSHCNHFSLAFRIGLLWYVQEECSAALFGVPWLPLSGALARLPVLVQGADMIGAYATGGLWVCAVLPGCLALYGAENRAAFSRTACLMSSFAMCAGIVLYGHYRLQELPFEKDPTGPDSFGVLLVDGNVDQGEKWLPIFQRRTVELYADLTVRGLAGLGDEERRPLVVWPETSMPFLFEKNARLGGMIRDVVKELRSPLLFGAPGVEDVPGRPEPIIYNRAFLMLPDGRITGHYDKQHLVPFGEYVPPWLDWRFLEDLLQGVGIYAEGKSGSPLEYDNLALGMLICYEGIFPWLAQERVAAGANVLVDISNDGWFGLSPAGRQHLYLTALRAIEQNRWLLRCANTGISAVIDSRGRVTVMGPRFQAGSIAARARICSGRSVYHETGHLLSLAALFLLVCLGLTDFMWKARKRPTM